MTMNDDRIERLRELADEPMLPFASDRTLLLAAADALEAASSLGDLQDVWILKEQILPNVYGLKYAALARVIERLEAQKYSVVLHRRPWLKRLARSFSLYRQHRRTGVSRMAAVRFVWLILRGS